VKQQSTNEIENAVLKAGESYVEAAELEGFLRRQNRIETSLTPKESLHLYLRDKLERNVAIEEWEHFTSSDGKVIYKVRYK
jgi:hypothetical protein